MSESIDTLLGDLTVAAGDLHNEEGIPMWWLTVTRRQRSFRICWPWCMSDGDAPPTRRQVIRWLLAEAKRGRAEFDAAPHTTIPAPELWGERRLKRLFAPAVLRKLQDADV